MKNMIDWLFRKYSSLYEVNGQDIALHQSLSNLFLGFMCVFFALTIFYITEKTKVVQRDKISSKVFSTFLLLTGFTFLFRAYTVYHNYAVIDTILRHVATLSGFITLSVISAGVKSRLEEHSLYKQTIKKEEEAKAAVEKAEAKIERLEKLIKTYEEGRK